MKLTLREARKRAGLSAEEAAKRLNVSKNTIYRYEQKASRIKLSAAVTLAATYGMSIDDLSFI